MVRNKSNSSNHWAKNSANKIKFWKYSMQSVIINLHAWLFNVLGYGFFAFSFSAFLLFLGRHNWWVGSLRAKQKKSHLCKFITTTLAMHETLIFPHNNCNQSVEAHCQSHYKSDTNLSTSANFSCSHVPFFPSNISFLLGLNESNHSSHLGINEPICYAQNQLIFVKKCAPMKWWSIVSKHIWPVTIHSG